MNEFEIDGVWWFPKYPNRTFRGSLNFIIGIGGWLVPEYMNPILGMINDNFNIINGRGNNGKYYTLFGLNKHHWNLSCTANIVFEGALFESEESLLFNQITFSIKYLNRFYNLHVNPKMQPLQLIKKPHITHFFSLNNLNYFIGCDDNFHDDNSGYISVTSPQLHHISNMWSNSFDDLLSLLSIVLGFEIWIENAYCYANNKNNNKKIIIYYSPSFRPEHTPKNVALLPSSLYSTGELFNNLALYISKGIEKSLGSVYCLFSKSMFIKRDFLDLKYLRLITALEIYYDLRIGKGYIEHSHVEPVIKSVIDGLQPDLNKRLRTRISSLIRHANNYTLEEKLKHLIDNCAPFIFNILKTHGISISKIVVTRNYYTHYNIKHKNKILDQHELANTIDIFILMIKYIIYCEMDMEREFIDDRIKHEKEYKYLLPLRSPIKT